MMYKIRAVLRQPTLAFSRSRRGDLPESGVDHETIRSPEALKKMHLSAPASLRKAVAVSLVILLSGLPAAAGVRVQMTQGLTMTGADGVYYDNTSGLTMTGADGFLAFDVNGISSGTSDGLTMTGADGLTMTGADGLTMTGADGGSVATVDGVTYTGANSYTAAHANGLTMTGADGLTMTGADGLTMTGADGQTWQVNSVVLRQPQGLTMTGADGLTMTGADGLAKTGSDGLTMTGADGLTMTGADTVRVNSANQVVATKTDGTIFSAPTAGLTMTGADTVTMIGADGVSMYGVQGLTMTGADGLAKLDQQEEAKQATGLMSFDPELALLLDRMTDDSNVNAAIVYHQFPYEPDFADLQAIGVRGGTRYRHLPVLTVTATRCQLEKISHLPNVRSIYGNRTLKWDADNSQTQTGLLRARQDADLLRARNFQPLEGAGVGVAILDTGIDGTHPDLSGRVIQNVKLVDAQGANVAGFNYATPVTGLPDTDQLSGHGTFVAGVIGGTGSSSGGKYRGYAPKARLFGLSAGDASLFNVLSGFDYILSNPALNIRVVNCSFSADTVYDPYDPINIATRLLAESRVNVVFSAGNTGPGIRTLNPYAQAPWVISVGAVDGGGRLAGFSSRGDFGSRNFRPTLVAPLGDRASLLHDGERDELQRAAGGRHHRPDDRRQPAPDGRRHPRHPPAHGDADAALLPARGRRGDAERARGAARIGLPREAVRPLPRRAEPRPDALRQGEHAGLRGHGAARRARAGFRHRPGRRRLRRGRSCLGADVDDERPDARRPRLFGRGGGRVELPERAGPDRQARARTSGRAVGGLLPTEGRAHFPERDGAALQGRLRDGAR
jgi:hypothetical protein